MSVATSVGHDRLIGAAEVLLEACQVVTGSTLRAVVKKFRQGFSCAGVSPLCAGGYAVGGLQSSLSL